MTDAQDPGTLREGIEQTRHELGDKAGMTSTLANLGSLARSAGDPTRAARLFAAAESLRISVGIVPSSGVQDAYDRDIGAVRLELGNSEFLDAWSSGRSMPLEKAVAYALEEPTPDTADTMSYVS